MTEVNIHEAKTHLSRLLARVETGEEIIIARGGKPIAKLVPIPGTGARRLGTQAGRFQVPDDFDAPLPEDLLEEFEA